MASTKVDWSAAIAAATTYQVDDEAAKSKQLGDRIALLDTAWRKFKPLWDLMVAERTAANSAAGSSIADFVKWAPLNAKQNGTTWRVDKVTTARILAIRLHTTETRATFAKWVAADAKHRKLTVESYCTFLPQLDRKEWTPSGQPSATRKTRQTNAKTRQDTKSATIVGVPDCAISFVGVTVGSKYKEGYKKLLLLAHNLERETGLVSAKLSEDERAEVRKEVAKLISTTAGV